MGRELDQGQRFFPNAFRIGKKKVERRHFPRFPLRIGVTMRRPGDQGLATTRDLCRRGCAITSSSEVSFPIGSFLILHLDLPGEVEPLLINPAVVRWIGGREFGVEFVAYGSNEEQLMAKYLESLIVTEK